MNTLKSLVAAASLALALAVSAAGQTPPVCNPGETHTPPCPATLIAPEEPDVVYGETLTLPEAQIVEIVSLVETALYALLLA
jgi:hypothetical protein